MFYALEFWWLCHTHSEHLHGDGTWMKVRADAIIIELNSHFFFQTRFSFFALTFWNRFHHRKMGKKCHRVNDQLRSNMGQCSEFKREFHHWLFIWNVVAKLNVPRYKICLVESRFVFWLKRNKKVFKMFKDLERI